MQSALRLPSPPTAVAPAITHSIGPRPVALTEQQKGAIDLVVTWFRNPHRRPYFNLFGYAGTGKTTIAMSAIAALGLSPSQVRFVAPTAKAAAVLMANGVPYATTLHALLYASLSNTYFDGEPEFALLDASPALRNIRLIAVDEGSMANTEIAQDLLRLGIPILVMADPGQLPPVKGIGWFVAQKADVLLTEIHRQAKDNPIIRASMAVRENPGVDLAKFADGKRLIVGSRQQIGEDRILAADQMIAGYHTTRRCLNRLALRSLTLGADGVPITSGGLIVATRNAPHYGVQNSVCYRLATTPERRGRMIGVELEDPLGKRRRALVHTSAFEAYVAEERGFLSDFEREEVEAVRPVLADWGYCITVHKAQGSQYRVVAFIDDCFAIGQEARGPWVYTGLTRAQETLIMVRET